MPPTTALADTWASMTREARVAAWREARLVKPPGGSGPPNAASVSATAVAAPSTNKKGVDTSMRIAIVPAAVTVECVEITIEKIEKGTGDYVHMGYP